MNEDISADFPRLQETSESITKGSQDIQHILDSMQSELQKVQWTGESANAYQVSQRKWSEGMSGLQRVLAAIGNEVKNAMDDYRANESRGAGIFNG